MNGLLLELDVNWTLMRRSEDVLDIFWTSYVQSIYVQSTWHSVKSVWLWSYFGSYFPALRISPYPVRMWENKDQNNFKYGQFLYSMEDPFHATDLFLYYLKTENQWLFNLYLVIFCVLSNDLIATLNLKLQYLYIFPLWMF